YPGNIRKSKNLDIIKAPDSGCVNCVLAREGTQTLDGPAGMSKQGIARIANTGDGCGSAKHETTRF
ncbi:MAG: hypothetical protein PUC49_03470, partial [Clostridiales bacterium]|nr:hypothetical protein [Clostridiales bacterium]